MHILIGVVCAGPLAQSVERRADNAKVESSRLSWTTLFFFPLFSLLPLLFYGSNKFPLFFRLNVYGTC